jgi:hypothetical protein
MGGTIILGLLSLIIPLSAGFNATRHTPYQPTPLPIKSGLIYVNHEDIIVTSQSWRVILYVDFAEYFNQAERLESLVVPLKYQHNRTL